MTAGAVDYFPKPLDMDRLVARIRQILDERAAGAVPAPA
jgi:DNA-binding response OmpR family regulator